MVISAVLWNQSLHHSDYRNNSNVSLVLNKLFLMLVLCRVFLFLWVFCFSLRQVARVKTLTVWDIVLISTTKLSNLLYEKFMKCSKENFNNLKPNQKYQSCLSLRRLLVEFGSSLTCFLYTPPHPPHPPFPPPPPSAPNNPQPYFSLLNKHQSNFFEYSRTPC